MYVILDVFSGNPNPTWELSQQQVSEFRRKISKLQTTDNHREITGLGYRGLIVEENLNVGRKEKLRFEVNNGVIMVFEKELVYVLDDKHYEIEKWLLNTAPKHIDQNVLNYVKKKLNNRIKN